ncbi:phage major capsid protein [Gracilibacillus saliphilus]|uniref:phage major capsid protein n=1 Tax=Gracilibacillus saliphilus TaxID=543890 RepID=UPI0013D188C6|nr:phage major capsid protein [Gracilibacillus saliphilus]
MSILRTNAEGLVPVELSADVIQGVIKGSSVAATSTVKEMTTNEMKLSALENVEAFKVGESKAIGTAEDAEFRPITLKADKYAVIVPVSNELLNESIADVFAEIQTQAVEKIQRKFDTDAVANINNVITSTGQSINVGDTAGQSLWADISDTMALIEAHGYDANTFLANNSYKNTVRKLKDDNGNALYSPKDSGTADELNGSPIAYNFGVQNDTLITGDFRYSVVGVQGQLEYKVLTEATVGGINLAEQDMSAIRLILPMGHVLTKDDAFASLKPQE